jgi:hypothetical protein
MNRIAGSHDNGKTIRSLVLSSVLFVTRGATRPCSLPEARCPLCIWSVLLQDKSPPKKSTKAETTLRRAVGEGRGPSLPLWEEPLQLETIAFSQGYRIAIFHSFYTLTKDSKQLA